MKTFQLRSYRIREDAMEAWLEEWAREVVPLRQRFGFSVEGAWRSEIEDRFVWILGYEGDTEAFEEANARYYDSPERQATQPDPARHLESAETILMTAVDVPQGPAAPAMPSIETAPSADTAPDAKTDLLAE